MTALLAIFVGVGIGGVVGYLTHRKNRKRYVCVSMETLKNRLTS